MKIDQLREFCLKLPFVTEDIKWGHDLCFSIGEKMFCVSSMEQPLSISFKVRDEEFEEHCQRDGFTIAPYVGRYKWVLLTDITKISKKELEHYIAQSYELIKAKLPKKILNQLK